MRNGYWGENKMQNEHKQNIYEKMSHERIKVVCAQIDILSYYNAENKERRFQELYTVSHQTLIDQQSERNVEEVDELITKFQDEIAKLRKVYPHIEEVEEIREKLSELERLSGTSSGS